MFRCLKEFLQDLGELTVENLPGQERELVPARVINFRLWHDGDEVNELLQLVVREATQKQSRN